MRRLSRRRRYRIRALVGWLGEGERQHVFAVDWMLSESREGPVIASPHVSVCARVIVCIHACLWGGKGKGKLNSFRPHVNNQKVKLRISPHSTCIWSLFNGRRLWTEPIFLWVILTNLVFFIRSSPPSLFCLMLPAPLWNNLNSMNYFAVLLHLYLESLICSKVTWRIICDGWSYKGVARQFFWKQFKAQKCIRAQALQ